MHYQGKDRFVVRDEIAKELETIGALAKTEIHINKVGTSERTKAVIEPRLSDQWFLKMEDLVKPAIKSVLEDSEIKLYPKRFENTYRTLVRITFAIGIFRANFGGDNKFRLISMVTEKKIL